MTAEEMREMVARFTYAEVARLHHMTGGELDRRNTEARMAAGEDGGW